MASVIEITDKDGWTKEFNLSKTIAYVGADPRNDIVLDPERGQGVSPRHLISPLVRTRRTVESPP